MTTNPTQSLFPVPNPAELAALIQLNENWANAEKHDFPQDMMRRLAKMGLIGWIDENYYGLTDFGTAAIEIANRAKRESSIPATPPTVPGEDKCIALAMDAYEKIMGGPEPDVNDAVAAAACAVFEKLLPARHYLDKIHAQIQRARILADLVLGYVPCADLSDEELSQSSADRMAVILTYARQVIAASNEPWAKHIPVRSNTGASATVFQYPHDGFRLEWWGDLPPEGKRIDLYPHDWHHPIPTTPFQLGDIVPCGFVSANCPPPPGLYIAMYKDGNNFPIELVSFGEYSYKFFRYPHPDTEEGDDDCHHTGFGWSITDDGDANAVLGTTFHLPEVVAYLPVNFDLASLRPLSDYFQGMVK